ncbi:MAG TPA: YraN family protein [Pseudonocardia sp.]|jgi:putative endonuclease|uniref:YraN family protein n=1 Tax=Pseudonocardia sp. TaxID=60912 RepID=UPI002B4B6F01|nr:YraN family protein [Pseudonocardia sp.]HLU59782.1 YraN family protein [Pseudonocardia sp.]
MAAKDVLGRRGEDLAARYLERRGLVILSRNWRCRHGEIDLVATDAKRLVVCEVKTRSDTRHGRPAEAVDARKAARIRRVTNAWLQAHRMRWVPVRFDVLAVVAGPGGPATIHHYEAAF